MEQQDTTQSQIDEEKSNDWIVLLVLLVIVLALGGFIWYFGWGANQGDIIKQEDPIIIKTIITPDETQK